jgi:hypothetical protein
VPVALLLADEEARALEIPRVLAEQLDLAIGADPLDAVQQ